MSQGHKDLLYRFMPEAAVPYAYELWMKHSFFFKLSHGRKSKWGDYRLRDGIHYISINKNLNKQAFLVTYMHEVAHLLVYHEYGLRRAKNARAKQPAPHGKEWKDAFYNLMEPLLNHKVFSKEVLPPLIRYMQNPKASSGSDPALYKVLHASEELASDQMLLEDVRRGEHFLLNGLVFRKESTARTRALCYEVTHGRAYKINLLAKVKLLADEEVRPE